MPGINPSSNQDLHDALEAVLQLLERLRVPYMVMGGMAISIWGRVRVTQDVDLSVGIEGPEEPILMEALQEAHFVPDFPQSILGHRLVVCRYLKPKKGLPVQVDLLLVRGTYQRQALHRAVKVSLGGRLLPIMTPEDLILHKLLANRPIDLLDIQGILEEQAGRLDKKYLTRWARKLGISKRLNVLLRR